MPWLFYMLIFSLTFCVLIQVFLAHLSRRLVGELIVYPWSSVRPSSSSTISNMNISAISGPITMKFYQKHHWEGGKAALVFGPDWIRTLVSMATDSSHRVIMEKTVLPLFLSCFSSDPFILASNDDMHGSSEEFEIQRGQTTDCGVSCP